MGEPAASLQQCSKLCKQPGDKAENASLTGQDLLVLLCTTLTQEQLAIATTGGTTHSITDRLAFGLDSLFVSWQLGHFGDLLGACTDSTMLAAPPHFKTVHALYYMGMGLCVSAL